MQYHFYDNAEKLNQIHHFNCHFRERVHVILYSSLINISKVYEFLLSNLSYVILTIFLLINVN